MKINDNSICHITTVHQRYDVRIFRKECLSLAKAGYRVNLIVNDQLDDEVVDSVSIRSLKSVQTNRVKRLFDHTTKRKAFKLALSLACDIYHIHDPELLPLGLKLVKRKKKVIYDAHEDVPRQILVKEWIPIFLRPLISVIFEIYENYIVKSLNAIIVPTKHLKERFQKYNKHIWIVSNYPSRKDLSVHQREYNSFLPSVYIGDLSYTRGIVEICKATSDLNININLCGNFQSKKLMNEILSTYPNAIFHGYLNKKDILKVLDLSLIGFVTLHNTPNDYYSYPIKLFEYMAAGLPVIASNFPVYKSIVEDNECGICVDPNNIDEISKAILSIYSSPEYAFKLGNNGKNAVLNKYNWESQIEFLEDCYHSLI